MPAVRTSSSTSHASRITALIGPSGCGKSTLHPLLQPHERPDPERQVEGRSSTTARTSTAPRRPGRGAQAIGMVFQKPNPFPKSIYDNIAFGPRVLGMKGNSTSASSGAAPGRALGRGQGPPQAERLRHVRRPAAAPLHRALPRGRARSHPHGRAVLGARPDLDGAHRGPDAGAQDVLHDRDRHAQHAAGRARLGPHRLLQGRGATRARNHEREHRRVRRTERIFPTPSTRAPRHTSRAGSDERRRQEPNNPHARPVPGRARRIERRCERAATWRSESSRRARRR